MLFLSICHGTNAQVGFFHYMSPRLDKPCKDLFGLQFQKIQSIVMSHAWSTSMGAL